MAGQPVKIKTDVILEQNLKVVGKLQGENSAITIDNLIDRLNDLEEKFNGTSGDV